MTGMATIKVTPDEMDWTVDVSIADATPAKAKARHDSALAEALDDVKNMGAAVQGLQTGGIRIQKNSYAPEGSEEAKRPYTCSTQLTFRLTDFAKYGALADALAKVDGVQIGGIEYAYSKSDDTEREALRQALLDARAKANELAVAANCYIDHPLEINEGSDESARPRALGMTAFKSTAGTPAPVAGQLEIEASVTVTYDLYYK